ncbi:hypothetical protein VSS37_05975 [Candidatus Thiothrix sp. Deng01]|uniref:DUF3987 domain-containing protein n=1 Tax=Candidatus Thiothrix phosphatis TaxID=3112415 RepID=A0ABU6CUK3_9GAMM|nr:hypothetical protein [Candidatus Thiothrix sp. Deng01]MEB4590520.1 hypothetical protein [Candidatus Thiothrix sp. Deng01]
MGNKIIKSLGNVVIEFPGQNSASQGANGEPPTFDNIPLEAYADIQPDDDGYIQHTANPERPTKQNHMDETLPAAYPVASSECFYGIAGKYALESCQDTEADPVGVLIHTLTYMGAYFGGGAVLRLGDVEAPPRLMAITTGLSSGGKGTSAQPSRVLAREIDKMLASTGQPTIQYRDGPMSSGEGIAYVVRDPSDKTDKEGQPLDLGVTDKRLMVIEEEFSAVLKASKREGNTISTAIRRLWDDGCYSPIIKNNPVTTTNAHVCFVGHITYDELIRDLDVIEYSNGFANRLLWLCVRRPKIVSIPRKMPGDRMDYFTREFAQAIRFGSLTRGLGLSGEAEQLWASVVPGLVKSNVMLTERARPQVLRIATIFALLDCTDIVTPAHLKAALAVWDCSVGSIQFIFGSAKDDEASRLLSALRKSKNGMTKTEISVDVYSRHMKGKDIDDLLKMLEAQGQIFRGERQPDGGKGRAATVFKAVSA